jgi:hypothetical protein
MTRVRRPAGGGTQHRTGAWWHSFSLHGTCSVAGGLLKAAAFLIAVRPSPHWLIPSRFWSSSLYDPIDGKGDDAVAHGRDFLFRSKNRPSVPVPISPSQELVRKERPATIGSVAVSSLDFRVLQTKSSPFFLLRGSSGSPRPLEPRSLVLLRVARLRHRCMLDCYRAQR